MVEMELPEDIGSFQEAERKRKEAVFEAGKDLMNQVMERYESWILKERKSFWKKDQREKKFQTIVGEVRRKRWRVFDWKEKRDRTPLDEWMQVGNEKATPALKQSIVGASVRRSYRQATAEVEQWTGVKRTTPGSKEREKMDESIGYIKNNREGLLPSKVPMVRPSTGSGCP